MSIRGLKGTYEEHVKYTNMRHIEDGETPTEWKMYFRKQTFYTYPEKDCFYAHKLRPYLVDGQKYSPKCGMTIFFLMRSTCTLVEGVIYITLHIYVYTS